MSVRNRLLLIAAAAVAFALVMTGTALYLLTTRGTNTLLDAAARQTADQVVSLRSQDSWPNPLPSSGTQLVQVIDSSQRVVSASISAGALTPLARGEELPRLRHGEVVVVNADRVAQAGRMRLVGRAVGGTSGIDSAGDAGDMVVVASVTSAVETGRSVLLRRLLMVLPLVMGGFLLLAWRMIGSALSPVEQLRQGAARIGSGARGVTDERLSVPDTHDEIAALATTLNDMLDRLWRSQERQRAFVADAAHELRSPLAGVRTELEVSQRLGEGGDLPERLLPELERLSSLVDDLLLLARSGDEPLRAPESVALQGFLTDLGNRYADARVSVVIDSPTTTVADIDSGRRGADVRNAVDGLAAGELSSVEGTSARIDRGDLLRVLTNVLDNAVRHARTVVRIETGAVADTVVITVIDDGAGIPDADRERVFDRFARLDEARDRDSGGSGLGLPIARALLRRHGGEITLLDAGPGVRARIVLPRANDRPELRAADDRPVEHE